MSTNNKSNILVVGDVHMDFSSLNKLINKKQPSIILQCGDFGYWPRMKQKKNKKPPSPKVSSSCKLYWCDGNHEDFESLLHRSTDELWPNVIYKPRGSTLTLPDGRIVLFMGGALSVDKQWRTNRINWFEEEEITAKDVEAIGNIQHVDIVISHTCPMEFVAIDEWADSHTKISDKNFYKAKSHDFSRKALSHVFQTFHPKQWFFGHWHTYKTGITDGCQWMCLDMTYHSQWWTWLT